MVCLFPCCSLKTSCSAVAVRDYDRLSVLNFVRFYERRLHAGARECIFARDFTVSFPVVVACVDLIARPEMRRGSPPNAGSSMYKQDRLLASAVIGGKVARRRSALLVDPLWVRTSGRCVSFTHRFIDCAR